MLRAYSDVRERCQIHPHRMAEVKCERCKVGLCAECTHEYRGQKLCGHCAEELEYIELSKPTFRDRLSEFFRSLRNTVIIVGIIAIILGGGFYFLRGVFNQPITPEQMARFRYAASGSFQTPEGINVNSTVLGASLLSFTSEAKGFEASHLINEYVGDNYPGWRSASATFPQDVVVQHDSVTAVSKVILTQQPGEPADTNVKDFEIDVSNEGPDSGWVKAGEWTAAQTAGPQRFTFKATPGKWIRLRIRSNYGSTAYTSLGEFDAYVVSTGPGTPTTATSPQ
ncbi:MAG TPA: discoidin domain-containing protein [Chloroflexota bacterium]|nr:discoidin domain-containing protein [Chloroflexota bacterium]